MKRSRDLGADAPRREGREAAAILKSNSNLSRRTKEARRVRGDYGVVALPRLAREIESPEVGRARSSPLLSPRIASTSRTSRVLGEIPRNLSQSRVTRSRG